MLRPAIDAGLTILTETVPFAGVKPAATPRSGGLTLSRDALTSLAIALEKGIPHPVKGASNTAPWRAAHRLERASKSAFDPGLQAFIAAKFNRLRSKEVIFEVEGNFPPQRQTSYAALHRWWH